MLTFLSTVTKYDTLAFCWCMSRKRAAKIAAISRIFSRIGDGYIYALLGLALLILEEKYGTQFLYTGLLAFTIELPIYLVCKNLIRRQRPGDAITGFNAFLVPSDKFSFPSGHTAAAFLMADLAGFYYPEFVIISFVMASLIGISRVLLGVHYPSDIAAGIFVGLLSSNFAIAIIDKI